MTTADTSPADITDSTDTELGELLAQLREQDVTLRADGDHLRFDAPTGAITDAVLAAMRTHRSALLAVAARDGADGVVASGPATNSLQRLAARHAATAHPELWNVATRLDLTGPLDPAALRRAVAGVVARHEALRTRLRCYGTHWVQEVLAADPHADLVEDGVIDPDTAAGIDAQVEAAGWLPFSLDDDRLVRFHLTRLDEHRWVLLVVQHHAITDATALEVLLTELAALYTAEVTGHPAMLPEIRGRYRDYAHHERHQLASGGVDAVVARWRTRLDGARFGLDLPADRPRPDTLSGTGEVALLRVDPATTAALTALARTLRVLPHTVLLTAYGRLLGELVGRDDVVVNSSSANRRRPEFARTLGLFTTSIPLRVRLDPTMSVRDAIGAVAADVLPALDDQEVATARLVEPLGIRDQPGAQWFPQTFFALNPAPAPLPMAGLDVRWTDVVLAAARNEIGLVIVPDAAAGNAAADGTGAAGTGMQILIEHSTDHLDPATVCRWGQRYLDLLTRLVADPDRPVADW